MACTPLSRVGRHAVAGATLLELLLALTIMAMVVGLAYATYGVIGRTQQRSLADLQRAERIVAVQRWLGQRIEGIFQGSRLEAGTPQLFFAGNAAGALWLAPSGSGRLEVVRVALRRHPDGRIDWVAQRLPYAGPEGPLDWTAAPEAMLVPDVRTLQWHYLDGQTGQWRQEWPASGSFYPARIRIEVADGRGPWPPLQFALPRAR